MQSRTSSHTTAQLAQRVDGEVRGRSDLVIEGVNSLEDASDREMTFITNTAHARRWAQTRAAAALISRGIDVGGHDPDSRTLIVVPNAALAMIDVLNVFAPAPAEPELGINPTAWVHPQATLGRDVRIGPHVSIDRGASIGDRVVLHAGVCLYADVRVGEDSIVHANTVVRERCRLGRRVVLHQNVSIGADGFGYEKSPDGSGPLKVPQIGIVEIGDDVEIGAGTCVDRAKFGATTIGAKTKIDNLVQIGHNCRIGRGCVIVGLCGVSGSVTMGDGVLVAGACHIGGHLTIGEGATLGATSAVRGDLAPGGEFLGVPAIEARQYLRQVAALRRLPAWMQEVSRRRKSE